MIEIVPISRDHYEPLFNLSRDAEAFVGADYYDQFCYQMDNREGFGYWDGGDLIGSIILSDFVADQVVVLHAMFHPDHRGKMNRRIIKHLFNYVFNELDLPRVISFTIVGVTDAAGVVLEKLGFRQEGLLKEAGRLEQGIFDVKLWGMLKRECRWI